jgi:hypothetical protein
MFKGGIPLLGLITPAACSGSTAFEPTIIPVSSVAFATATSLISTDDSFEVANARRILGSADRTVNAERQGIRFSIDSQGDKVLIAGDPYIRDPQEAGYFEPEGDSGDTIKATRLGDRHDASEIIDVSTVIDGLLNTSAFVIGFDTNPTEVAAVTGSEEMTGKIFATAHNGFNDGFAVGDVTLNADFDRNKVSGDFDLTNRPTPLSNFEVPDIRFSA